MSKAKDWADTVTITRKEYEELCADASFLACLQHVGVDSWEGYEDAQAEYEAAYK